MEERSVDTSHSAAEQATSLLSSACESSPRRKGPTKVSFIENSRRRANCLNKRLKSFVKKVCLWEDAVCCPNLVLICWLFCFVNRERKFLQWRGARCFCLWKLAKAKNKFICPLAITLGRRARVYRRDYFPEIAERLWPPWMSTSLPFQQQILRDLAHTPLSYPTKTLAFFKATQKTYKIVTYWPTKLGRDRADKLCIKTVIGSRMLPTD